MEVQRMRLKDEAMVEKRMTEEMMRWNLRSMRSLLAAKHEMRPRSDGPVHR
jgi:hypothetical protein